MSIFFRLWKQLTNMTFSMVAGMSFTIILIGTVFGRLFEPETFPSFFDSFWWTMTTLTTVGYGDFYPVTVPGRFLGIFLFIFGIGIIGVLIGKTVDAAATYQRLKKEGKLMYRKSGHYIYIGWSLKTEKAIEEVLLHEPKASIVLIDNMPKTPCENDQVHFVQGNPSDERTLLRANLLEAKRVGIFADATIEDPLLADGKSLMIASAVEALSSLHNKDVYTVVEVCEDMHIPKFQHIRVDDFILSNDSVSMLMAKATLHPGTTTIFRQLLSKAFGGNIHMIRPDARWKTYRDAAQALLDDGASLIAVNDQLDLSEPGRKTLQPEDHLYIVCTDASLARLQSKFRIEA